MRNLEKKLEGILYEGKFAPAKKTLSLGEVVDQISDDWFLIIKVKEANTAFEIYKHDDIVFDLTIEETEEHERNCNNDDEVDRALKTLLMNKGLTLEWCSVDIA